MSFLAVLMAGLGDEILARPVIRQMRVDRGPFFVSCCYPQIFADIAVECVALSTTLRNQSANIERYQHLFVRPRHALRSEVLRYEAADIVGGNMSMLASLEKRSGIRLRNAALSLPPPEPLGFELPRPYVVFRPASVRTEWNGAARNPDPKYLEAAVLHMRALKYAVVSIAAIGAGEVRIGRRPLCDVHYDEGQLSVTQVLSTIQNSCGIIGGVGFALLAGIAAEVPVLVVGGGNFAYNSPGSLIDGRWNTKVVFAVPDRPCACADPRHQCNKVISRFDDRLIEFARVVHEHARAPARVEL